MAKMSRKAVLHHLGGDPRKVSEDLVLFGRSADLLSFDDARAIDMYKGQWIGVYHDTVAATAPDHPALLKQLVSKGISPAQTVVRFIDEKRKTFIL